MRYGNEVKKAVLDIEKVKEKITGDRMRIQRMRNDIPDKIKALARRNPSDSKAIREIYYKLFEMNVDENTLSAVTNQIEFLKAIEEIEKDFEKEIRHTELKQIVKQYCLTDLTLFRSWVLAIRKYFTEQELMDAKDEIHRLQSFRQFIICSDRIFLRFGRVDSVFEASLNLLKCGKKLNQDDKEYIKAVFKYLKKKYPTSGLGVSEDEKVQIVNAMGGRKGHWFKCPNGMNLISIVHFYQIMVFERVLIIAFKTRRYKF